MPLDDIISGQIYGKGNAARRLTRRRYVPHGKTVARGLREGKGRAGDADLRGLSARAVLARSRGAPREDGAELLRHYLRVRAVAGPRGEDGGLARRERGEEGRSGRSHAPELSPVCSLLLRDREARGYRHPDQPYVRRARDNAHPQRFRSRNH